MKINFSLLFASFLFISSTLLAKSDIKFTPVMIPVSEEIVNPDRGFFRWNGNETAPVPCVDNYQRYNWSVIEKEEGVYDFSMIKAAAEKAKNDPDGRGTFSFGIRCVVQGVDHAYPAYLDAKMGSWKSEKMKCWVPDWNNAYFLERLDALVAAMGKEFNNDPRIGYVEIRSFGNWGEWHLSRFELPVAPVTEITPATIHQLIDSYVKAFPDKQLIMLSDNAIGLEHAMSIENLKYPIGWRRDSWCHLVFLNLLKSTALPKTIDRWKTAPVIFEAYGNSKNDLSIAMTQVQKFHASSIGNGNIGKWDEVSENGKDTILTCVKATGYRYVLRNVNCSSQVIAGKMFQIKSEWSNVGVAPIYTHWDVTYSLVEKLSGNIVWSAKSKLNLKTLLPSLDVVSKMDLPVLVDDQFEIPATLPKGKYNLELSVVDPTNYFTPLKLAIQGRKSNGAYPLGEVKVSLK